MAIKFLCIGLFFFLLLNCFALDVAQKDLLTSSSGTFYETPNHGEGIVFGLVDIMPDIYNPFLFKADGRKFNWADLNNDGIFEGGLDGIDYNGNGTLEENEKLILKKGNLYKSEKEKLNPKLTAELKNDFPAYNTFYDFLYLDLNQDGRRNFSSREGFTDKDPAFGEPIFITEDLNNNGILDKGENLIQLKTSKFVALFDDNGYLRIREDYREKLINFLKTKYSKFYSLLENRITELSQAVTAKHFHGTGVSSILAGGNAFQKFSSLTYNAEIFAAEGFFSVGTVPIDISLFPESYTKKFEPAILAEETEQARVLRFYTILLKDFGIKIFNHSYGGFFESWGDNNSPLEKTLSEDGKEGIIHVVAAGNGASGIKQKEVYLPKDKGYETKIWINKNYPELKFNLFSSGKSPEPYLFEILDDKGKVLYKTPEFKLDKEQEHSFKENKTPVKINGLEKFIYTWFGKSSSGISKIDVILPLDYSENSTEKALLTMRFAPRKKNQASRFWIKLDIDTGWVSAPRFYRGKTKNNTITWPGYAENIITVASYENRGNDTEGFQKGSLGENSGRGKSIKKEKIIDLAAQGNIGDVVTPKWNRHIQDKKYDPATDQLYMVFNGTSSAAPITASVVGIVYREFEKRGMSRNFKEIYEILTLNALKDKFTKQYGEEYSNEFGYGKVNLGNILENFAPFRKEK